MWKKLGSIGPLSNLNDSKSSRSRDQSVYEPFSQITKTKLQDIQSLGQSTELFCPTFLNKKKSLQSNAFSSSKVMGIQGFSSLKLTGQNPQESKNSLVKKAMNRNQVNKLKQKIQLKILNSLDDSFQEKKKFTEEQNLHQTESTQIFSSGVSLDQSIKLLKHAKSSPELKFEQFHKGIKRQQRLSRKQKVEQEMKDLKREYRQMSRCIKEWIQDFGRYMNNAQNQIKDRIKKGIGEEDEQQKKRHNINKQSSSKQGQQKKIPIQQYQVDISTSINNESKILRQQWIRLDEKKNVMVKKLKSVRRR